MFPATVESWWCNMAGNTWTRSLCKYNVYHWQMKLAR